MAEPSVFCDFVQVTVPVDGWADLREAVQPVFDAAGLALAHDDKNGDALWRDQRPCDGADTDCLLSPPPSEMVRSLAVHESGHWFQDNGVTFLPGFFSL